MQLTPPGIPLPQETIGAEDGWSAPANAGRQSPAISPAAKISNLRHMCRDSNLLSADSGESSGPWYLRFHRSRRRPREERRKYPTLHPNAGSRVGGFLLRLASRKNAP